MSSADDDFDADAEREIIDLLGSLPRPAMPADVRARIDDALAAEAATRPEPATGRGTNGGRWFALAAAAAVAVLAGFIVVPRLGSGTSASSPEAVPAAAPAPASPSCSALADEAAGGTSLVRVTQSGTTYTAAGLQAQAEELLKASASCAALADGRTQYSTEASPAPSPPSSLSTRTVDACVVAVAKGRSVVAVDVGWYDHKPSVTMVLLAPKEALAVDCAESPVAVLARTGLP